MAIGGDRLYEDLQSYYNCGQCNTKIFHLKSDEPVIPCPECGWQHKEVRKYADMPSRIKIDINQYG